MSVLLVSVTPSVNFELVFQLTNGEQRRFDVKPYLSKGVFKSLQDEGYFCSVQVAPRFVHWPQGQDLSLDTLLARSVPV